MADRDSIRSGSGIKAYPTGKAQGGRAMQAVSGPMVENDGSSGSRTVIRETSEGRAIGRTRDGFPMVTVDKRGENPYMESGRFEYTAPGELNPERGLPAKWRFIDIDPAGDYLGEIIVASEDGTLGQQVDEQPTPIDTGILRDNIDSLAIGYPRSNDPVKDLEAQEKALDKTLKKKAAVGMFPASLWSGKMRLFLQAQYGMAEDSPSWRFVSDPNVLTLNYKVTKGETNYIQSMGLYASNSPGIYTADDGTFWFLNITRPGLGTRFDIYACQILGDEDYVDDLVDAWLASTSDDEKAKLEGYIFSSSRIDLPSKWLIGSYDPGVHGHAICYGWKWNKKGDKASIVIIDERGDDGDKHYVSTEIHLSFTYLAEPGTKPNPRRLSFTGTHTVSTPWIDPWYDGSKIWAPETELDTRLEAYSIARHGNLCRVIPNFGSVPFYGYYKDDVWSRSSFSKSTNDAPPFRQWSSGINYDTQWGGEGSGEHLGIGGGVHLAGTPWEYHSESFTKDITLALQHGGYSFEGRRKQGSVTDMYCVFNGSWGETTEKVGNFYSYQVGQGFRVRDPNTAPGYTESLNLPYPVYFPPYGLYVAEERGSYTYDFYTRDVDRFYAWCFIIPGRDAEAAYIAYETYDNTNNPQHTRVEQEQRTIKFHAYYITAEAGTFVGKVTITPWSNCYSNSWYGDSADIITEDTTIPATTSEGVSGFNAAVHGVPCTPSASYSILFATPVNYPYFDPGMWMTTSYGLRYKGSEGIQSPVDSVTGAPSYMGWA